MNRIEFNSGPSNPFSGIISLIFFVLIMVGLFFAIKWIFIGLLVMLPILLLITFLINADIVLNYFNGLWNTLKNDILSGIIKILTMPFSIFGLFLQALILRKVAKTQKHFQDNFQQQFGKFEQKHTNDDDFVDYEEVEDSPKK